MIVHGLQAEVIGSTLLLSEPAPRSAVIDVRPGLLAAELSAAKHASLGQDAQAGHQEYVRVLAALGWRYSHAEQHQEAREARSRWSLHQRLARGIARLCSQAQAEAVAACLEAVVRLPDDNPGRLMLRQHAWREGRLNMRVALLDTQGTLSTYGVALRPRAPLSAAWLRERSSIVGGIETHCSVAHLSSEHYARAFDLLQAKLGRRGEAAMARLPV